jgi:RNA polymerase sigma factor (sigma-70 family)
MVFRICLKVLRRHHDAEDAFQATFLALARKAAAISHRESLGSWLFKVAYRIALRAGVATPQGRLACAVLPDHSTPEPIFNLLSREAHAVVNEEVNRLPHKYRIALVMCDMEGRTIAAAAQALGCPPGTVSTRLARARQLLRRRLARRGFESGPALSVHPALPVALVSATVRAALFGTTVEAAAAGAISAHVAALTKGALPTMPATKWILTTAVLVPLSLLAGGGAFLAECFQAEKPRVVEGGEAGLPPAAEEQVTLRWKFEKDKPFYQEMTTITRQDMLFLPANANGVYGHEQTLYFSWTPVGRDKDGNWVLKQKVEAVRFVFRDADGKRHGNTIPEKMPATRASWRTIANNSSVPSFR